MCIGSIDISQVWVPPTAVLKHAGLRLVPFIKTVVVYFLLWPAREHPNVTAAVLKALPIACLCLFVALQGAHLQNSYARKVFVGLIFSALGDVCLIWHREHFITGMVAFGVAHVAFMYAFGLNRPYRWLKGIPFLILAFIGSYILYPGLKGVLVPGVILYTGLLCMMAWRAFAQVDVLDGFWTWTKVCACIGAMLFMISDFILAINKFYQPIYAAHVFIMLTYYSAQLFIALSAFNTEGLMLTITNKAK